VDDESDWQRQVLIGLLVLVTVGAVVGGIVALVTIKAADIAGIDDTSATTGLHHPPGGSGRGPTGASDTASSDTTSSATSGSTTDTAPTQPSGPTDTTAPTTVFTLAASPLAVSPSERIDLNGSCAALPSGTVLQVQRREGGQWTDFPVTATCSGGSYSTYILTGHSGPNMFRMLAIGRAETSNTVRVQVS
jgi:hypothetical protein